MSAAAGNENSANGGGAAAAGEAGSLVNGVAGLEEAGFTGGVDVVGDGRAAEADGVLKHLAESEAQALELGPGEAACHAPGADASVEEAFVGIDVADADEKRLVEERSFDGETALAKKRGEGFGADREGFDSGSEECGAVKQVLVSQAAEAARIDKAQLAAAGKSEARVSVGWNGHGRIGDEEAAGHAEMDDPLGFRG